ncbi:MAG: family 16 glycosylhydrolase [Hyphomonas sp.]
MTAATVLTCCASVPGLASATEGAVPQGYVLVWSDEFDTGAMPDPEKWTYDTYRNSAGWWNNELQYYSHARPENSRIENGVLIIEARREDLSPEAFPDWGGQAYTSARLHTHERASWTYGYFEVRAKLPCGYGTWPAIWALPDDPREWPEDGEIDIMEHVGQSEGKIHGAVHTRDYNHVAGTQKMASVELADPCGTFHVYTLHWTAEAIRIGVDGRVYFTHRNTGEGYGAWPFDRPYHLLLNIAIGGWGGGGSIDDSIFPVRFEIDYVRVWQAP